ncbi:UDP-glucose 4-epimerase family protein [Chitinimonas sp. BJB300]|uniref:UDP-glucose 4-epimerase family protein n=1 Tax=Chitinimonas sp. BJB300 TaxID=1559339 RepID=UPI000C1137B1|nr:SDR family oxidoreductase [Chitinimonas sp. BJB300]PHV11157.1 NAD-dependent dehydratase [Chitinimonas sp. BJB300]TSJ85559.1 SDR family oxidoreductase [Chitinimonas sp. BJB300]
MSALLITGANGFVGHALSAHLVETSEYTVRGAIRQPILSPVTGVNYVMVDGLCLTTSWTVALKNVEVVVHTAARVHIMNETSANSLAEFRRANVEGTISLAKQAAAAGVRRFIYISSVKVNGEETVLGKPYTIIDLPAPMDAYGISKMEAERDLRIVANNTGMDVVIIRPPLVYGPGVKANFRSLMRCISNGIPLPLGTINNKRSLVALDNLVDLITHCIKCPLAANQTFFVSDGHDLSTTQLVKSIGLALGKTPRLIPIPSSVLIMLTAVCGKRGIGNRLCGSLQVDISNTVDLLGWRPPVAISRSLQDTVQHFLNEEK